jgi:hypothetical protein
MREQEPQEPLSELQELLGELAAFPATFLTRQDVRVIDSALKGYSGYLRGFRSAKHQEQIEHMVQVRRRIARSVLQAIDGQLLTEGFTFDDLEVMADALAGFARAISQMVPKSAERDDILHGLRLLRGQLETLMDHIIANDTS